MRCDLRGSTDFSTYQNLFQHRLRRSCSRSKHTSYLAAARSGQHAREAAANPDSATFVTALPVRQANPLLRGAFSVNPYLYSRTQYVEALEALHVVYQQGTVPELHERLRRARAGEPDTPDVDLPIGPSLSLGQRSRKKRIIARLERLGEPNLSGTFTVLQARLQHHIDAAAPN